MSHAPRVFGGVRLAMHLKKFFAREEFMTRLLRFAAVWLLLITSVSAEQKFIVRTTLGKTLLTSVCVPLGCSAVRDLGDPAAQVYLLSLPDAPDAAAILNLLRIQAGVISA